MSAEKKPWFDTYDVRPDGSNPEAEKVVARRLAAGDHVHSWSMQTGTLCLLPDESKRCTFTKDRRPVPHPDMWPEKK